MPTSPTPITALPTAPSRADPANFATRADSFLGALSTFRSEANALATNAYNNAVEADADATAAASSASAASSSASTATTKASEASASATAAQTSANTAAALLDAFDDRYLGSKASDPTVDNDGNPLLAGALYWSTTASLMKVYDGSAWGMAYVPSDFYLPRSGGTMTGPLTLSGGTANGVLYLNGSKVATSGSALTFDGTKLTVAATADSPTTFFQATNSTTGGNVSLNAAAGATQYSFPSVRGDTVLRAESNSLVFGTAADFKWGTVGAELMRLTSTGLGIGTSSPGAKLDNRGELRTGQYQNDPVLRIVSQNTAGPASTALGSLIFNVNANNIVGLTDERAAGIQVVSGSDERLTNLDFYTAAVGGGSSKMRLDSSGNLVLNGTTAGASSVGTFTIFNGTAPTGSVTDGVILFAQDISSSSELRVRDEAGNVTTLSPHNFSLIPEGPSEDMAWAYYSEKGGKRINVDMLKLARMVEKLTGEKLVYEV